MSFDMLQDKIREMKNPTVAGLDARIEYVPAHIQKKSFEVHGETLAGAADAIWEFNMGLIDALCDIVPAVKPQSAYYENLGWAGMAVMEKTIRYAKEKGMYVIADIKRGDIGSTASAYADAWLGATKVGQTECPVFDADCVTLNGYMGSDAIKPFLDQCTARNKSAFVLAKTSNPSSVELQDMVAGDRLVYTVMGDLIERWGKDTAGKYGYQALGAVIGATHPSVLKEMRRRLERTFFLVPGYGAQGGTAADVRYAFDELGRGAIVNASRSIMCAWKKTGKDGLDYQQAARDAAIQMREELKQYITIL
ncbi:MAG TPA: orotidine-5'-phosphate decarboxylase [Candidatus Enterenecus stercoripullorum]|nr:orotidine-5'-phosphate decarboxylase [Candidatus Enterenecus stercoripullorum]